MGVVIGSTATVACCALIPSGSERDDVRADLLRKPKEVLSCDVGCGLAMALVVRQVRLVLSPYDLHDLVLGAFPGPADSCVVVAGFNGSYGPKQSGKAKVHREPPQSPLIQIFYLWRNFVGNLQRGIHSIFYGGG